MNKKKIIAIILGCLYGLFSIYCIHCSIQYYSETLPTLGNSTGNLGVAIYALAYIWAGAVILALSLGSLTKTYTAYRTVIEKNRYSRLLAALSIFFWFLTLILLIQIALLGVIIFVLELVDLRYIIHKDYSSEIVKKKAMRTSRICDIICGLMLIFFVTINIVDAIQNAGITYNGITYKINAFRTLCVIFGCGGFVFPIAYYIKRTLLRKMKQIVSYLDRLERKAE